MNIKAQKRLAAITLLGVVAVSAISLFIGKYPITFQGLLDHESQVVKVFLTLRVPRVMMAVLGGFCLGTAGFVYQTIFQNPLASPDIIGVASGASAGAAFAILFLPASQVFTTISAFGGGIAAVFLAMGIASLAPEKNKMSIVLSGIAVNALAQTILMLLKLTADPEKELASIEYWIMGSLNGITRKQMWVPAVFGILGLAAVFLLHRHTLLLSLDADEAQILGMSVGKMRLLLLLLATLVTAAIISQTGLISFLGLVAPHIARRITKDNRRMTMVLGGLFGSLLLLAADIFARSIAATELPLSIFTSLLGAPFLIYLIFV